MLGAWQPETQRRALRCSAAWRRARSGSKPPPTGLTVAAYFNPTPSMTPSSFAVDLIWQPIDATGLMTPLAGYNVYRQRLDAGLHPIGASRQINTAPQPTPAFHDAPRCLPLRGHRHRHQG